LSDDKFIHQSVISHNKVSIYFFSLAILNHCFNTFNDLNAHIAPSKNKYLASDCVHHIASIDIPIIAHSAISDHIVVHAFSNVLRIGLCIEFIFNALSAYQATPGANHAVVMAILAINSAVSN
jgi:hypothetical protein